MIAQNEKLQLALETALSTPQKRVQIRPTRMELIEAMLQLYKSGPLGAKLTVTLDNLSYFPELLNSWHAKQGGLKGINGPIKSVLLYLQKRSVDAIALDPDRLAINYRTLPEAWSAQDLITKLRRDLPMYIFTPSLGGGQDNTAVIIAQR